jgi:hypothetical protein
VPALQPVEVAHRQRPGADERHLAAQHVEQLGQLVEREAPQDPPDGVTRGSLRILKIAPSASLCSSRSAWRWSASWYIVRNFRHANGAPPMPGRIER